MEIASKALDLYGETHYLYLAATGAPTLSVPVHFADEASKVLCAYREKFQFGASEMEAGCGNIYNSLKRSCRSHLIQRAYLGRKWQSD